MYVRLTPFLLRFVMVCVYIEIKYMYYGIIEAYCRYLLSFNCLIAGFLKGGYNQLHVNIERVSLSEVPEKEEDVKVWLHKRFVRKDK